MAKYSTELRGRGALNAADVDAAMREIRRALIEADVSLEVVRAFVEQVAERAVGAEVTRSVTPGQQVVKIVNDELVAVLGSDAVTIDLNVSAAQPAPRIPALVTPRPHYREQCIADHDHDRLVRRTPIVGGVTPGSAERACWRP